MDNSTAPLSLGFQMTLNRRERNTKSLPGAPVAVHRWREEHSPTSHPVLSRDLRLSSAPPGLRAVPCALSHPVDEPHHPRGMQKVGCHLLSSVLWFECSPEGSFT